VIAFRNVLRQRRRSAVGVASVAFGVIALLLAAGFIEWSYWGMRESMIRSGLGHIQVTRKGYFESGLADPFVYLLPAQSEAQQQLEAAAEVATVSPRIGFSGLASLGDTTISFLGEALDPDRDGELASWVLIVEGENLSSADPREIIMGKGLATNLGAKIGDTVVLLASTPSGGINAVETRVRGLFLTVTKAYDDTALRVPLATAQELLRIKGTHRWVALLRDTESTSRVVASIRSQLDP
jgi:putative ABC transport system permease protein